MEHGPLNSSHVYHSYGKISRKVMFVFCQFIGSLSQFQECGGHSSMAPTYNRVILPMWIIPDRDTDFLEIVNYKNGDSMMNHGDIRGD